MKYLVTISARQVKWNTHSELANNYVSVIRDRYEAEWLKQTNGQNGTCEIIISTEDSIENLYENLVSLKSKVIKRIYDKNFPSEKYDGYINVEVIEVGKCIGDFSEDLEDFLNNNLINPN